MSNEQRRAALEGAIASEVRIAQNVTDAIDQLVAELFGVSRTDARCMDIIERRGRITAGELAREAGLSTGAVTALLDRLERVGAVRRVPDATDRRKVLVELTPETIRRTGEIFGPMAVDAHGLLGTYPDDALEVILDFLRRGRELSTRHLDRVREQAAALERERAATPVTRAELERVKREVKADLKATKLRVKEQVKAPVKRAQQQVKADLKRAVRPKRPGG